MCLSFCSKENLHFTLLGESIFLELAGKNVRTREVYDVFFKPDRALSDVRLLCISPHNLISATGDLSVKASPTPGAGGPDDIVYNKPLGAGGQFEPETDRFSVTVHGNVRSGEQANSFSGKVLTPTPSLPEDLQDEETRLIMEEAGTLFELSLGDLQANQEYIFRLIVKPERLLGVADPRQLMLDESRWPMHWAQYVAVYCPKTCRYNFITMLRQEVEKIAGLKSAASALLSHILKPEMRVRIPELHRIVLVLPTNCELGGEDAVGGVFQSGMHILADSRLGVEWTGGRKHYWTDEIDCVARRVWQYMMDWSQNNPKPKEFLSEALGIPPENCAAVVDGLHEKGLLALADENKGLYRARLDLADNAEEIFERLAKDKAVLQGFRWMGYEIRYWIRYTYLSEEHRKEKRRHEWRSDIAFWIALAGLGLSLIGIILAFVL